MSSILEALRKSEKHRQQQIQNNSDQLRFGEQNQSPKNRNGFYGLVALLLLIAAGLWLYQQGVFTPHNTPAATPPQPQQAQQPKAQPAAEQGITPPDAEKVKQQAAQQMAEQAQPTPPKPTDNERVANSQSQKPTQIVPLKVPPHNQPAQNHSTGDTTSTPTESQPDKQTNNEQAGKDHHQPEPMNQPSNQQAEPSESEHLRLYQLPYAVRKDLPPIKLNIHVYDPKVENRMVILNGERYAVGDEIGEIGSVKEITKAGVVIEVEGITFMIPKL